MRKIVLTAALAGLLSGCANGAHNDVLLFGTDTKVAFDFSSNATNGGAPELTLGFKRREAVWMPLVVNGSGSAVIQHAVNSINKDLDECRANAKLAEVAACYSTAADKMKALGSSMSPSELESAKYQGSTTGFSRRTGEARNEKDTYSVFASFGGDFSGSNGGRAALAQFFATGIAAQRLGENPRIDSALSVQSGEAAKNRILEDALAQQKAGYDSMGEVMEPILKRISFITNCLGGKEKEAARNAALETVKTKRPDVKNYLETPDLAPDFNNKREFEKFLGMRVEVLVPAFEETEQVIACKTVEG